MRIEKLIVIFAIASISMSACSERFDYRYLSLTGMQVSGYGRSGVKNLRKHAEMPISYRLERDAYTLLAKVDKESIWPAVFFSVEGKGTDGLKLLGTSPMECFGSFTNHFVEGQWFDGSAAERIRFLVWPPSPAECAEAGELSESQFSLTIEVFNRENALVGREEVSAKLVSNGTYVEIDGP